MLEEEKKEKEKYFYEYKTRSAQKEISKNYASAMYDILTDKLENLTEKNFHFQKVNLLEKSLSFKDYNTTTTILPKNITNLLNFKNKIILDFGCGRGQFCNDAINKFSAEKVYGTDLASVELGLAEQHHTEECVFFTSGATSIPLPDASVNIATAFLVLEHVHEHNIDKMFEELSRITKDGFIFTISHREANRENLRRCSKNLKWWCEKISSSCDTIFMYYPAMDKYKWGTGENTGLTRLICAKTEH